MANRNTNRKPDLVRTSILVKAETDRRLREMAERAERPLSWEIRRALEAHVEREPDPTGAAA